METSTSESHIMSLIQTVFRKKQSNLTLLDPATRPLPKIDEKNISALKMSQRQRSLFFNCIDIAALSGFAYEGDIGSGSLKFYRRRHLMQNFTIYIGDTEKVLIYICMSNIGKTDAQDILLKPENIQALDTFAQDKMYECILSLMKLDSKESIKTLDGSCIEKIGLRDNSFLFQSDFDHVRTHIGMAIDMADILDAYATKLIRSSDNVQPSTEQNLNPR